MKFKRRISFIPLLLLAVSPSIFAQQWSGILAPSRAIDWTQAGVVGGIPDANWSNCTTTQCNTVNNGTVTASSIAAAISSAPNNTVIQIPAGTFTIGGPGITINRSNVVLRGAGANQTKLSFTSVAPCYYGGAAVCFSSDYGTWGNDNTYSKPGQSQAANWTAGYSQGATSITVTNVGNNGILNGQYIYLNQANDTSIGSGLFNCDLTSPACSIEGGSPGQTIGSADYSQLQIVKVTAGCATKCTGAGPFTLTITPGLYGTNWSAGKSPYAWWPSSEVQYAGIENMSLDLGPSGIGDNGSTINFMNSFNCWVSGVAGLHGGRAHVWFWQAAHDQLQNSYFYQTQDAQSQSYGVEEDLASDNLVVNNIFQQVTAPLMGGSQFGNSFLYNYGNNDYQTASTNCMYPMFQPTHDAGAEYNLYEGNIGESWEADVVHGTAGLDTAFRDVFTGYELGKSCSTIAITIDPYNRDENIVGTVLGTPGVTGTYSITDIFGSGGVYALGQVHGSIGPDSVVGTTLLRWGNYDSATATVRWCGNSSDTGWSTTCGSSSEVPTGISSYANPIPSYGDTGAGQNAMTASFLYSSAPSWWPSGKPWPPIGPDVTNGNVGQCTSGTYQYMMATSSAQCSGGSFSSHVNGGHAYSIPAMDCYFSLGGPPDGSGSALSFNAGACYSGGVASQPPSPAGGLLASSK